MFFLHILLPEHVKASWWQPFHAHLKIRHLLLAPSRVNNESIFKRKATQIWISQITYAIHVNIKKQIYTNNDKKNDPMTCLKIICDSIKWIVPVKDSRSWASLGSFLSSLFHFVSKHRWEWESLFLFLKNVFIFFKKYICTLERKYGLFSKRTFATWGCWVLVSCLWESVLNSRDYPRLWEQTAIFPISCMCPFEIASLYMQKKPDSSD